MPYILIPHQISKIANLPKEIVVSGDTIASAIDHLIDQYPIIEKYIFIDSEIIHPFLAIFIGKNNIMDLQGLSTKLEVEQVVTMLYNISGG